MAQPAPKPSAVIDTRALLHVEAVHDPDYPRIQVLTVEGVLNGTERVDAVPQLNPFAMATRAADEQNRSRCYDHKPLFNAKVRSKRT